MLFNHSLIYLLSRLIPALLYFLLIALFTRLLSPSEFGIYSFVIAGTTFAMSTLNLWLCTSAMRMIKKGDREQETMSAVFGGFALILFSGFIISFAIFFTLDDPQHRVLLLLSIALFATSSWLDVNLHILQGLIRPGTIAYLAVARAVLSASVSAPLAWYDFGASGIMLGAVVGNLLPSIYVALSLWRPQYVLSIDKSTLRSLLVYGVPLSASYIVGALIYATDRFAISAMEGVALLGFYAAGYELANRLIRALTDPIGAASLPLAVDAFETSGEEAAVRQLKQNHIMLALIGVPAALGLAVVSGDLVEVVLGPEFREMARAIVPIVAISTLLSSFRAHYLDHAFHLSLRAQALLLVMIAIALLNLVLTVFFIIQWGIIGAAYGTLFSQVAGFCLSAYIGRKVFPIPFELFEISKIVIAAIGMTAAIALVPGPESISLLVLKVVVGAIFYAILLLLVNPADLRRQVVSYVERKPSRIPTHSDVNKSNHHG